MELLPDELRQQLPLIRELHDPADKDGCIIYARLFTQHTGVSFYLAEGEQRQSHYLLWGLLISPQFKSPLPFQIAVSQLMRRDWLGLEPCRRDEYFKPACWAVVERRLANLRRPL